MRASSFPRSACLALALGCAALGATSCGRTGLWLVDPCNDEGEERECSDTCGTGTQVCKNGTWSECSVPTTSRACQNDCGSGTETCERGRWSACEVPTVKRSCSGTCGEGTETCESGRWGTCVVPPTDFPCENTCGEGLQHCESGRLGRCEVEPVLRDCESRCGTGHETCIDGAWQACDAPQPGAPVLHTVLRDFSPLTSPDFERPRNGQPGDDPAIVEPLLGPDDKPEWSGDPSIHTVESKETFDTWYRDVPGINVHVDYDLALSASSTNPGFFIYDNLQFFPLDDDPRGLGNEGRNHDFHFTLEAKLTFRYSGGEVFSFTGDDDMWVFINRHLAINLGGLHQRKSASVNLDEQVGELAIVHGEIYPIHIFFAERHTVQSTFTLETSVADQGSCPQ
jgi:fibro-slime domain-containing protein